MALPRENAFTTLPESGIMTPASLLRYESCIGDGVRFHRSRHCNSHADFYEFHSGELYNLELLSYATHKLGQQAGDRQVGKCRVITEVSLWPERLELPRCILSGAPTATICCLSNIAKYRVSPILTASALG